MIKQFEGNCVHIWHQLKNKSIGNLKVFLPVKAKCAKNVNFEGEIICLFILPGNFNADMYRDILKSPGYSPRF